MWSSLDFHSIIENKPGDLAIVVSELQSGLLSFFLKYCYAYRKVPIRVWLDEFCKLNISTEPVPR